MWGGPGVGGSAAWKVILYSRCRVHDCIKRWAISFRVA